MGKEGSTVEDSGDRQARSRFSVALISAAEKAMTYLMRRTEMNKSDIVNRAVQVYAYMEERQEEGYEIFLRAEDGTMERLRIM
ncbi:hypothetical protein [Embleya sp. NPDC005971]|uniref:hypothetical protein n=1 Tax=unclassified Embleya TaxID=2699296 RepID=UPI003408F7CA